MMVGKFVNSVKDQVEIWTGQRMSGQLVNNNKISFSEESRFFMYMVKMV